MVKAAGLRPSGWARCYWLAVALTLAAAPRARSLAVARCSASAPAPVITPTAPML